MRIQSIKRAVIIGMLAAAIPAFVWAEDAAPVYDVDNMPPPFDNQSDVGAAFSSSSSERSSDSSGSSLSFDQRLGRVEQQVKGVQKTGSAAKVEQLQTEVQSLRGQVEELTHQLQQIQAQVKTMYTDLDKRLATTNPVAPLDSQAPVKSDTNKAAKKETPKLAVTNTVSEKSAAPTASSETSNQPNVAEEQQIYQAAYDLIKAKKYNEAITTLQKITQKYPSGQFAANAHYWLGELYGLTGKNDQSAAEFSTVISKFPDSAKVSEAQLKLAMILISESKWSEAKSALRKVMNAYPGTASARLASQQLKQLKQTGH